jgi:hypothetical protein
VEPPRGVDVPSSPSRTRSPKLTVVGETLADDARTASPLRGAVESRAASPHVPISRVESPPHVVEAVGAASAGDVVATTPPGVIDIDPINAGPAEDLVQD